MDKKLLRKIKQEGIGNEEYTNEFLDNALIAEYQNANSIPNTEWTNNQLFTRICELKYLSYYLYTHYPEYDFWNSEYYDILDEIDNRYNSYIHHRHEQDY